ncbi:MAG TPA: hypothetical protein VLI92_01935 [Candidatus Saccharimonadales bacterium]|nr:hypothetical protein [Candidatus Saccharimonadales bacterium]
MHKSVFSLLPLTSENLEAAKELNLNSIFIISENVSDDSLHKLRTTLGTAVEIYGVVTCFEGKDLLEKFPDAKPVEATGKDTLGGICPTHEGIRNAIVETASDLLLKDINGIWLNHIRYPSSWESAEPNIMDTCYCDRCLRKFSEYLGEPIVGQTLEEKVLLIDGSYYIEWLEFKSLQITSLVKEIRDLITASGKKIKLGLFAVPWEDKEYGAGIKRIIAQDFAALVPLVDILSPGLYHKMCGKDVEWIKQKVNYFWETGIPQLPIIQSAEISDEEFKKAIDYAGSPPSSGVCIYNLEDLMKQPQKLELTK